MSMPVLPLGRRPAPRPGVRPFRWSMPPVLGLLSLLLALLPLAACGGGAGSTSGGGSAAAPMTVGLTFIPDPQFAPFYVADSLGYYKDAGLQVSFHHHNFGEDEFGALAAGREDTIIASGDEVLTARSQGLSVVYLAQIFTKYPVVLIVPSSSPIHSAADLKGHSVGVPFKAGGTYIALLALLKSAGLRESDITVQALGGFTQVQALEGHKVDAVMGFFNNEPLQLQQQGFSVRTIDLGNAPLISNGLGALQGTLQKHPDQVKAFVAATLKGVDYTTAHPQEALTITKKYVPGLDDPAKAADALVKLRAAIPLWQHSGAAKPGFNDPAAWQAMGSFMQAQGLLKSQVDVTQAFSNDYLPS